MHCQNFISIEVAVQELSGGRVHSTSPLGQVVDKKHRGRARVKTLDIELFRGDSNHKLHAKKLVM